MVFAGIYLVCNLEHRLGYLFWVHVSIVVPMSEATTALIFLSHRILAMSDVPIGKVEAISPDRVRRNTVPMACTND